MAGKRMISDHITVGVFARSTLEGYAEAGDWRRFDATAAALVCAWLGFKSFSGTPKGVDAGCWKSIVTEMGLIGGKQATARANGSKNAGNNDDVGRQHTDRQPTDTSTDNRPTTLPTLDQPSGAPARKTSRDVESSPLPLSTDRLTIQDLEDAFNDLWDAYPRKSGKGDAKRAFFRVVREEGVAPATIFYAVMEQSKSPEWTEDGGKFVPALAKWLDGGRWEDVLSAPPQKNSGAPPAQMIAPPPYDGIDDEAAAMRALWAAEAAAAKEAQADV